MNFPLTDTLKFLAVTVYMEAAKECYNGKLAVAYVIVHRAVTSGKSVLDVILSPFQFSCWNTDSPTRKMIDNIDYDGVAWYDCYRAACSAFFGLEDDPSGGATHYLNKDTVMDMAGRLPSWYQDDKVTAEIERHTFLKI